MTSDPRHPDLDQPKLHAAFAFIRRTGASRVRYQFDPELKVFRRGCEGDT